MKAVWEDDGENAADLAERLAALNGAFGDAGTAVFSCTVLSPAVVYDKWLLSRSCLCAKDIEDAAGEPGSLTGYDLAACYSRMTTLSGWNAQAQLPKADVWAICAGSAFLFKKSVNEIEGELNRLAGVLAKAESGIGERWEEGLGEAVFCHRFHVERRVR